MKGAMKRNWRKYVWVCIQPLLGLIGMLLIIGLPLGIPTALLFFIFKGVSTDNIALLFLQMFPVAAIGFFTGLSIVLKLLQFMNWVETKLTARLDSMMENEVEK